MPRMNMTDERLQNAQQHCLEAGEVINRIGEKWSACVITQLAEHTRTFGQLRTAIPGVSARMLTRTLRGLERDGLVLRELEGPTRSRPRYRLSPLGQTLLQPLFALAEWATANRFHIQDARDSYDQTAEQDVSRTG